MLVTRAYRLPVFVFVAATLLGHGEACAESLKTQIVLATYRLEHPETSGTGFIVNRSGSDDEQSRELVLVTAAHVFQAMSGDTATIVLRERSVDGDWTARPQTFRIRDGKNPLWIQHPKQDVAILQLPEEIKTASIPVSLLATQQDWDTNPPEPGSIVRTVGHPHASAFKPSPAGFPLTRIGCIASYPVAPSPSNPTFLVDYNTFEGDSGGPVYFETATPGQASLRIAGLIHGQHFLDERYKLVYASGLIKQRLGLAIVVNSISILETLTLPELNSGRVAE